MNKPLLTVIVPCYNVEKYLDKCISSIVTQTYSNLEILLIDDGSPDNCGLVCDAWQERDSRIRVIHKQNEGPSYARKTGVENSTAEYVTFVDADDWIDADMYADMMSALLSTGSDIAQCGVCKVFEDGRVEHRDNECKMGNFEVVGRTEGVLLILKDEKWRSWLVCKIFKKHLFENIQFSKGCTFGDDHISLYLFHKASKSVYLHDEYYSYFQRNNSITRSKDISVEMKNHLAFSEINYERYLFVKQHPEYHKILPDRRKYTIFILVTLLHNIYALPQYFPEDCFKIKVKQLNSISLSLTETTPFEWKFYRLAVKISPICYKMIRFCRNKLLKPHKKSYLLLSEII